MNDIDLLLLHTASTWALVGLIWTIQLVQYPGFARVGEAEFASFHAHHSARITWVVGPLMGGELATGVALYWARPVGIPEPMLWTGLSLIAVNWAITAFVAVPLHRRLGDGQLQARSALVTTNWLRTIVWSARGVWTLYALRTAMGQV